MPSVEFDGFRGAITMQRVFDEMECAPTRRHGDQLHGPCPVQGTTPYQAVIDPRRAPGREVPWITGS